MTYGCITSFGLRNQNERVVRDVRASAALASSNGVTGRCSTARQMSWIMNHVVWQNAKAFVHVSALLLSLISFSSMSGSLVYPFSINHAICLAESGTGSSLWCSSTITPLSAKKAKGVSQRPLSPIEAHRAHQSHGTMCRRPLSAGNEHRNFRSEYAHQEPPRFSPKDGPGTISGCRQIQVERCPQAEKYCGKPAPDNVHGSTLIGASLPALCVREGRHGSYPAKNGIPMILDVKCCWSDSNRVCRSCGRG